MIGNRIREERERLGLTQERFAEIAACSRRTLIEWEGGKTSPKADQLSALAEHKVDIYYILTGARIGVATVLTARESALVDNYRASPEDAKKALEKTSAALAKSPQGVKGDKAA